MDMSLQNTSVEMEANSKSNRRRLRSTSKDINEIGKKIPKHENELLQSMNEHKGQALPLTPRRNATLDVASDKLTPKTKGIIDAQTPRRSTRKSVKPVQEYEEIVNRKNQLRSASKLVYEGKNHDTEEEESQQPKWTPAKVGRVSQRRSRKSRRTIGVDKNLKSQKIACSSESEDPELSSNDKENEKSANSKEKLQHMNESETAIEKKEISHTEVSDEKSNLKEKEPEIENINKNNDDGNDKIKGDQDVVIVEVKVEIESRDEQPEEESDQKEKKPEQERNPEEEQEPKEEPESEVEHAPEEEKEPEEEQEPEQDRAPVQEQELEQQKQTNEIESQKEVEHEPEEVPEQEREHASVQEQELQQQKQTNEIESQKNLDKKIEEEQVQETLAEEGVLIEIRNNKVDTFGSHLKSNIGDISDLGLNPLIEADTTKEQALGSTLTDKSDSQSEENTFPTVTINDDTFNDSDCILLKTEEGGDLAAHVSSGATAETTELVDDMQPLYVSDDDDEDDEDDGAKNDEKNSPLRKRPRIVLTTQDGKDELLNSSALLPKEVETSKQEKLLNTSVLVLKEVETPKRYSSTAQRKSTPFRPRISDGLHKRDENDTEIKEVEEEEEEEENDDVEAAAVSIIVSTMEPKEIVLNSIRKRSWSVCIGGAAEVEENKRKNVTFYSPANQTTILEDIDMRIAESVQKNKSGAEAKTGSAKKFVTQRRKRSMSFDSGMIQKHKSPGLTPSKVRPASSNTKQTRTNLPNFTAIHQKNYAKMENLVDYVQRKAERAKVLSNSAVKNRTGSAQKRMQPSTSAAANENKSKAAKRIYPHTSPTMLNTTFTDTTAVAAKQPIQIATINPLDTNTAAPTQKENDKINLPNPRLGLLKAQISSNSTNNKNKQLTPSKNANKPMQARQQQPYRPAFNLSTALDSHAHPKAIDVGAVAGVSTSATTANTTTTTALNKQPSFDEKMASRRQRRMDMFKGRGDGANSSRTTPNSAQKANYSHLIRGVRSNRRFELQMAHRKHMEQ